jgi:hypothetical protein
MSAVIRREGHEAIEVSASWDLRVAIRETQEWLARNLKVDLRGAVLDIGFDSRLGSKVAVQGEVIPLEFMQLLVSLEIELWLSIYPPRRE